MISSLIRRLALFTTSHRITILADDSKKTFIVKWATPEAWLMLALVSQSILSSIVRRHASPLFLLFCAPFSYFTLCLVLNRTIVEITNRTLSVRHRPLPWPGNKSIPIDDIGSVYVERIEEKDNFITYESLRMLARE